jgi:single-strand DNA-binding protein
MKSINKAQIMGNVGETPRITSRKDGTKCASFSVATSNSWIDKKTNERQTVSEWHRIVVFNEPLVDIVEKFVKKGSRIYIDGELKTRKYKNKEGVEASITEIVLKNYKGELILLDKKGADNDDEPVTHSNHTQSFDDLNDDIPF